MSDRLLFISDLHLQADRPELTQALIRFLASNKGRCSALYILGDLFELWIGDDADSPLAEEVATALQQFSEGGSRVHLMHGNRDFLLGRHYAQRCGAELIQEPYRLQTSQGVITLLHGDVLCSDDLDYQQFRKLVRNPAWQAQFLEQTVSQRLQFAAQARSQSRESTSTKSAEIMDVNPQTVKEFMAENQTNLILHGHTHRPAVHELSNPLGQRIVLGDWDEKGWFVQISEHGLELKSFPIKTNCH